MIDEQLEALQKELLKKANAKQGFEELADEIEDRINNNVLRRKAAFA